MGEERSDGKSWGKTVLGWFITQDQPGGDVGTDADALIARYASAPAPTSPVELAGPLPPVVGGTVDFDQVYTAAGIDAAERDRVGKAQELLRSLPAETPQPVKQQIVEASLRAFGVATDRIIEAAVAEIEALEGFIVKGQAETQAVLADGTTRIAELEKQVADVRAVMQQAVTDQGTRVASANAQKLEIQRVLEFFGREAVAKVVQESAKLHQPK